MSEIIIERHRGTSRDVERPNSFEALVKSQPGEVLELDVFLLVDGNLAIVHHKDLGLGEEGVERMDLKEFQSIENPGKINAGHADKGLTGPRMPLLEEAIMQGHDRGLGLQIELKASSVEKIKQLSDKILENIDRMRTAGVFVQNPDFLNKLSFLAFSVEGAEYMTMKVKERSLAIPTFLAWPSSEGRAKEMAISATSIEQARAVLVGDWFEKGITLAQQKHIAGIAIFYEIILQHPEYVKGAQEKKLLIMALGVVNDIEERKALATLGVSRCVGER